MFLGGCIPPYRQVVHSAAAGCLSICVTASALARSANWLSFAGRPGQPGLARHETRHGRRVAVRKARSCVVVGLFCVTTVSIVCTFKAPVPDRAGDGLDPSISMVAGPAGGPDGVVGSVLAHGCHPDGPRSRPPLATEHNLNPEPAKRGLCPTQPASECAGTLWPTHRGPSSHSIPPTFMPICKRSDALPVECVRSAMSSRTWAATGSASMMFSIASRPEIVYLINSTFNCLDIQSRTSKSF